VSYLEEAAALLRKVAETNEKENRTYGSIREKNRKDLAMRFAVLAAIEKGILPAGLTEDEAFERIAQGRS
jgi:hypothetical protein